MKIIRDLFIQQTGDEILINNIDKLVNHNEIQGKGKAQKRKSHGLFYGTTQNSKLGQNKANTK